ncbi:MAG: hypothetical protein H6647_12605 [Anaerolineales bacterium]|nr:hypothetical protein [Anaerolineales bacterium]
MAQKLANFTTGERLTNPSVLEMLSNAFATINPGLSRPGDFTINPGLGVFPGDFTLPGDVRPGGGTVTPTAPDNPTVLPRVRPGDVITADMMNMVLEMLETLAAGLASQAAMFGPDVAALRLGSMAQDTHTLVALGAGFDANGGVFLDGQSLLAGQPTRGINLAILDAELNLKYRRAYDTFAFSAQAELLASDLQQRTEQNDIVIGMTSDAFSSQLTSGARAALASVGAEALGRASQARDGAAFIGVVPNNQTRVSFNYLTSALPADQSGTGGARLTAPPFAWGLYSRTLQRFLLGGASGNMAVAGTSTGGGGQVTGGSVVVPLDPGFGLSLPREVLGGQSVSIIRGIGDRRSNALNDAGVTNLALLAEAQPEVIAAATGVGVSSATTWINQAQSLLRG